MRAAPPALSLAGLVVLALTTLGLVAAALAALSPHTSPVPSPLVITLGQSRAAEAALSMAPADATAAVTASQQALSQSPYDSSSRLRLAYLDSLDGEITPEGLAHLERSYELLPLDQYVATWRVGFALEHWGELSPQLRKMVEAEAFSFLTTSRRREMVATLEAVSSPTGVMRAAFWRERLKRRPAS